MKKIEAIIRSEKLESVIEGLSGNGYPGLTISEVKGHGKQKGILHQWRGTKYSLRYLPKVKIEVVLLDEDLEKTIQVILENARTGNIGDGKIFVSTVDDVIKVRTGESGEIAI